MDTNLTRIIVTQSFKVVERDTAIRIVNTFEVDDKYYNCYFVEDSKARFQKPLQIRENLLRLKNELASKTILVLALQEDDHRLVTSKPRTPRERKPKPESVVKKEPMPHVKPERPTISLRPVDVPEA